MLSYNELELGLDFNLEPELEIKFKFICRKALVQSLFRILYCKGDPRIPEFYHRTLDKNLLLRYGPDISTGSHPWFVEEKTQSRSLALRCSYVLHDRLRCNIGGLKNSHPLNSDVLLRREGAVYLQTGPSRGSQKE